MTIDEARQFVWSLAEELNVHLGQQRIRPEQQHKTKRNLSLVLLNEEEERLAIRPPSQRGFYVAPTSRKCAERMVPFLQRLTGKSNDGYYQPDEREPYWYLSSQEQVRKVAFFFAGVEEPLAKIEEDLQTHQHRFEAEIDASLSDSSANRLARIKSAKRVPEQKVVSTTVFVRNPDVVAEALLRAKGICEGCQRPAPFFRKSDGSPYLEVHHVKRLIDGGEDVLENVKALCPNCHRKAHYGR